MHSYRTSIVTYGVRADSVEDAAHAAHRLATSSREVAVYVNPDDAPNDDDELQVIVEADPLAAEPWVTPDLLREVAIRLERAADPDANPDDVTDATVSRVRAWWLETVSGADWDRFGEPFVAALLAGYLADAAPPA
jgi:hypothetical protein